MGRIRRGKERKYWRRGKESKEMKKWEEIWCCRGNEGEEKNENM